MALLSVISLASSKELLMIGFEAPMCQISCFYLCLAVFYQLYQCKHGRSDADTSWWIYPLLAFLDVQVNYLTLLAIQYINIAIVVLVLIAAVPLTAMLCRVFLEMDFTKAQWAGCALITLSCCLLMTRIFEKNSKDEELLGYYLLLPAIIVLSTLNVFGQWQSSHGSRENSTRDVTKISQWSAIISAFQFCILEYEEIRGYSYLAIDGVVFTQLAVYALSMCTLYTFDFLVLENASPAISNLSRLTGNVYIALVSIFVFHDPLPIKYWISLLLAVIGMYFYSSLIPIENTKNLDDFKMAKSPQVIIDVQRASI